ncbi:MAG: glycosyltransferase family 2 protein [Thiotrichaceae bacterium]
MNKEVISIIVPCLNEVDFIEDMVESVVNQTVDSHQFELIIVDGGSNDGTRQILWKLRRKHPFIRLLHNPRKTTPHALNIGIRNARGKFIARMDVHAKYPPNYLERLYKAIIKTGAANVGCCIETLPSHNTSKAKSIAYTLSNPFGVGNSYFRIGSKEMREVDTVPFGFFRRDLFKKIGLFDTDMTRGQDHEFNARIKKAGMKIYLIPGDKIRYYARENFKKLSAMMYQYGFSRPVVNKKIGSPATLRQFVPLALVISLISTAFLAPFNTLFLSLFALLLTVYLTACGIAASHIVKKKTGRIKLKLWAQIIMGFITSHLSYGFGYMGGLLSLLSPQNSKSSHMAKITR